MSYFFNDQPMIGMSQVSGQAEAIDPRLSDDTFDGFSSPSAAGHTEDSSSHALGNTVFPSSPTLTLGDVMAANHAATKNGARDKARQVDSSPLPFGQAAAQGMMQPPPGPGQDGQIPPAQDGLPQEAMARATFNELLGMYTPHVSWHRVDGLGKSCPLLIPFTFAGIAMFFQTFTDCLTSTDTQYFSREPIETRIRYLFDFMANADGGRLFKERISSNVRIQRASLVNANRHVEIGEQELNILNGLASDEPVDYPHGGAFRVEGRAAITDKLNTDKFWQDVMGLELRLSELALERVEVARKATIPLYDFQQGLQITPEAAQVLEELYARFQDMRVEAAQLLREILQRVGEGKACSNMLQRHRNELWDIWGGRPGVESVL